MSLEERSKWPKSLPQSGPNGTILVSRNQASLAIPHPAVFLGAGASNQLE
jgi:hypothetical protein